MSRITEIEIAGTKYPLNFSVKASKEISARYGDLENIDKAFVDLDETIWLLSTLIEQGVIYKKMVENEEVKGISIDELEVVVGFYEIATVQAAVMGAITAGTAREVETEPDPKNAKTKQGK